MKVTLAMKLYSLTFYMLILLLLSGCSIFPKQVTLKKTHQQDFTIEKEKYVMKVTASAYTSCRRETDSTPYLAAWNNRLKPKVKSIAVSRDLLKIGLTNKTRVTIDGLSGTYIVLDKMNKRWKKKIDIYMGCNLKKALRWGKRKVTIRWTKKTIELKKKKAKKKS
jgi:3D (Asp-Asp-Asp) domain-containing protein